MVQGRTLLSAIGVVPALLVGLLSVASGTALARAAHHKRVTPAGAAAEACVVRTLPGSFVDQGQMSGSSTVADVVTVSCEPVYARAHLRISATELYDRCDGRLPGMCRTQARRPATGRGPASSSTTTATPQSPSSEGLRAPPGKASSRPTWKRRRT